MARKKKLEMTPTRRIMREILLEAMDAGKTPGVPLEEPAQVDAAWDAACNEGWLQDAESEFREGQEETGLPAPGCRHYESKSVARKMRDGTWVGWVYWSGGGKHGEPQGVPWMEEAYLLDVREEERVVVVRTFKMAKG